MTWLDNVPWDDAIEASKLVAIGTAPPEIREDRDPCKSTEVLYRPGELIVAADVYDDQSHPIRRRLDGIEGLDLRQNARDDRDSTRAAAADTLGLRLVLVEDWNPIGIVAEARRSDPEAEGISINHVVVATPQRHGGCAPPRAVTATAGIPGAGTDPAGVRIGVLDTGLVHPEPAGFNMQSRGQSDHEDTVPGPAVGHGTMVAGVIATYAPGATLVIRRVLDSPLGEADELEIADALDALPTNLDVINASFGGFALGPRRMLAFEAAVNRVPQDTVVVASVGNEGVEEPVFMAAFDRVLGVASVEGPDDASLQRAPYSNFGNYVKLCARGTDVESTFIAGHAECSGTSFAAPKVAAAVAILLGRGRSPVQAVQDLVHAPKPPIPGAGKYVDPLSVP